MTEDNYKFRISIGMISIIVLLVINLVAFAFTYGILSAQVSTNTVLIEQNRILQQAVSLQLNDYNARLARIEVLLSRE